MQYHHKYHHKYCSKYHHAGWVVKACLSIPVSPKYNALSQTTGRPNKFNGLKEKQHMAVCRISFVCFVNKFPPESALTPTSVQDRDACCQNSLFLHISHSLAAHIFNLFSESATTLSEHCLVLILVLSSTYFCEFKFPFF